MSLKYKYLFIFFLQLVKKWLGILIEGMSYLSKYNLIHRNLKPSSLYLRNYNLNNDINDLSLQIGDFGVYTVMKDAKTKTRISVFGRFYLFDKN
jgi:probable inactive protein kinase-like protein SgK071